MATEPTAEDLESSRDPRFLRQRIKRQQGLVAFLQLARRIRIDNGTSPDLVDVAINQAEQELRGLIAADGGRIVPRKRAKAKSSETCTVYIDECGAHSLTAKEDFGAFCLASVIVRDQDLDVFDAKWRRWKRQNLGSENECVHEPDVRKRSAPFYRSDPKQQEELLSSLSKILAELEFCAIACVLRREQYVAEFGNDAMNCSLPQHGYLMTLHFTAERIALALQNNFGGAKARLILESRGPKEDAAMQYEFARLFLDGTAYLHPGYFRRQFFPGLEFGSKKDHLSGLEIADLLARPCADKVLDPTSSPERWEQFRSKFCIGEGETKHSILGLKIVPWDNVFKDLWKS